MSSFPSAQLARIISGELRRSTKKRREDWDRVVLTYEREQGDDFPESLLLGKEWTAGGPISDEHVKKANDNKKLC